MATKSTRTTNTPLTEDDRARIGHAREVLQEFEKRQVRMKALDTVCALAQYVPPGGQWTVLAKLFEDYIWEGKVEG